MTTADESTLLDYSNLNDTTEIFEQDSFVLENKISKLEETISKSINEVARVFEMKYRDFLPHLISVTDCQDKIQSSLKSGNSKLKRLQSTLSVTEENISKAAEEAPNKKLGVICGFIDRLKVLSEIEACFSSLWMGSQNGDHGRNTLADTLVILKLEDYIKDLEKQPCSGNSETVNDRILPLIIAECASRRSELLILLEDFYNSFVQFRSVEQGCSGMSEMIIKCSNTKTISDNFSAMDKLGIFGKHLKELTDSIWKIFCHKIIHSSLPDSIMHYRLKDFDGFITFAVKKETTESSRANPIAVFAALEKFLNVIHETFFQIKVDGIPFVTLFGDLLSERLIETLTKDCLVTAIPYDKKDPKVYTNLVSLCSNLCEFLVNNHFTSSNKLQFDYFLENYDKIFVDRRCHHFISQARTLITQPYIELTEVGSSKDENEECVGDIVRMIDEKMKLEEKDVIELLKSPYADKFSTKLFQFQKCKISTSTFQFVQLFQENICSAIEAANSSEMEMCRLFTTARNVIELFISLAPLHHQQALTTVPQIAAVFFNNCHYICNRLVTIQTDMQKRVSPNVRALNEFNFANFLAELRILSANILEQHLVQIRRQISTAIGSSDIFIGLRDDSALKKCERSLNTCTMHVGQVANVWKEVMPEFVLAHSLGALISHLLSVVTGIVLAKEDITASDATLMVDILTRLLQKLKKTLSINEVEVIHRVCEEPYFRISEVVFCLNANLVDIEHRWCEGKGPLSEWLKANEVKHLIRALFQNTERRAQLLTQIN